MAILHVRNVPEDLYQRLQELATERKRSLSAEVILLLAQAIREEQARRDQAKLLSEIRRRRRAYPTSKAFNSVKMLREDRAR